MPNVYNRAKANILTAYFTGRAVQAMLVQDTHLYDADDNFVSDVVANELTVAGYARQTVTFSSVDEDDVTDRASALFGEVEFPALTAGETIGELILFDNTTGLDTTRPLIASFEVNGGTGRPTNGQAQIFRFNALDPGAGVRALDA